MIRVLVADDSATARALLVAILSEEPGIKVVGEARTGREAVNMAARLNPDLITMDIHMPDLDGLRATQEVMTNAPRPIIIVSSAARLDDVELSLEATRAGALLVVPKPAGPTVSGAAGDQRHLVNMVKAMAHVKVVKRHTAGSATTTAASRVRDDQSTANPASRTRTRNGPVRLIAIAASTGGPAALEAILSRLPGTLSVPVLVVQHIAHGFTGGLAHWLGNSTSLRVKVAEHQEAAVPGTVYVAADDRHLGVRLDAQHQLRLVTDAAPPLGSFRPSASYLFRSAAEAVGERAINVILTGMGDDGVEGLRAARRAGGLVIAQDEASSVIYGMPREAVRAGIVDRILPVGAIAAELLELTR